MKVAAILLVSIFLGIVLWIAWQSRDTTVYAPGFSEANFRAVPVGASRARVIQALGQPLSVEPMPDQASRVPGGSLYWYSKMRGVKGEYVRSFLLDRKDSVVEIHAGRIGHYLGVPGESPSSFLEWLEWYVF